MKGIVFSRDYQGPLFGLGTKTRSRHYDKLVHFALSATAVLVVGLVLDVLFPSIVSVGLAVVAVLGYGLGTEFEEGREAAEAEGDQCVIGPGGADGFSFLDLAANAAGAALAFAFFWRL